MCNKPLKNARVHLQELLNADITNYKPVKNPEHNEADYPPKVENKEFCDELKKAQIEFSENFDDRFLRCRGQALKDFYILRYGKFKRVPDLVVFPKSHEDVEIVVELSKKYCAVIGEFYISFETLVRRKILKIFSIASWKILAGENNFPPNFPLRKVNGKIFIKFSS